MSPTPLPLSYEIQTAITEAVVAEVKRRMPPGRETYLKVKDASDEEHLNTHPDTTLRLIRAGKLRAVGSGKMLRVPLSAIADYLTGLAAQKAAVRK
jgi:excisionase family DNA binding protein